MSKLKADFSPLDRILREMPERTQRVGRKMAFLLEGYAKRNAPVDTGALRNSIYTVTQQSDGFGTAVASARKGRTKKGKGKVAPSASVAFEALPTPGGHILANVGPCVEYAEYVEFGTSKWGGKPYMVPAVERIDKEFGDPKNWEAIIA